MAANTEMARLDSIPAATLNALLSLDTTVLGALAENAGALGALAENAEALGALAENAEALLALVEDDGGGDDENTETT